MRIEKITLSGEAYLEAYIADATSRFERRAILVIPGGGYSKVCANREGEPIALAFLAKGYNAFVLHYTVGRRAPFPRQTVEAAEAIAYLKAHAEELGHAKDTVFVVGFSAGGHLAASTAVYWKHPAVVAAEIDPQVARPTGVMLIYPVISAEHHTFSFHHLLCTDTPTKEQLDEVSIERHVDASSSPAFLMHTSNDEIVDVKNSLDLAAAYHAAGVEFELHVYPDAPHGASLGNRITWCGQPKYDNPAIARWVDHACLWADSLCAKKD